MDDLITQRHWTEQELRAEGFEYFERKKQLVMAARLRPQHAPLAIVYDLETVYAEAGDVICFDPAKSIRHHLFDYDHWSIKSNIFLATYRKWDVPDWTPNPSQTHLMRHGCRPYYKHQGVWALRLKKPIRVQSLESPAPIRVEAGGWLAIGAQGEPWHMDAQTFQNRYNVSASKA